MAEAINQLNAFQFLERTLKSTIIDVRSPGEYQQGHIPGAINLPLFNDRERAAVGIAYTHSGKEAALLKGLEIVGPKLEYFVKTVSNFSPGNEVLVHCWRGGMRSEAMAWLLSFAGFKASVLQGGYKAYRRYTRQEFSNGPSILILGGMTGSGKTELLHYLSLQGEQVIDLEGLANHRGSAFGALGQKDQPTNEQFENDLAAKWLRLDPNKPVWIEDESRNIGKVIIPGPIFEKMIHSRVVLIEMPFGERVNRLVEEYGGFDRNKLAAVIEKIRKRIGGDVANKSIQALINGEMELAISSILKYYDRTYQFGLSKRAADKICRISFSEFRTAYLAFHH